MKRPSPSFLENRLWLSLWSILASFGTYACMYAFRKPFTAATFEEAPFEPGIKLKLVGAQVLGYTLSKVIGIKVISEMPPLKRGFSIVALIGLAEFALVLFAISPQSLKPLCLFLNGLPLGMVFGLVLGFLEGRKLSEAFIAGLCASFILADGFVKSVGAWLLARQVPEAWMPATAGAIFIVPLLIFVWMLRHIPAPSKSDEIARSQRSTMNNADRIHWLKNHGLILFPIIVAYIAITVMRSLRADFAPELWQALGETAKPAIYTQSELWVALSIVIASGFLTFFSDNKRALTVGLGLAASGSAITALALVGRSTNSLSPFFYLTLLGIGLYLPYVLVHTTLFERLIAVTRDRGNMAYLMYLADASGYLGYSVLMFLNRDTQNSRAPLEVFEQISWIVGFITLTAFSLALIRFRTQQYQTQSQETP